MTKPATFSGTRDSDARVLEMLKRYVRDQRASAAILTEPSRPLQQRLSSARV
jgi:hypothetical protein